MKKKDSDWKKTLTPEEYHVLREKGTETPFSGEYVHHNQNGRYTCKGCGAVLFSSASKFDSHCGWPSFSDAAKSDAIALKNDLSFGMQRIEVICKKCKGHLGHVFDDGPQDKGGKRYCINSVALGFKKK